MLLDELLYETKDDDKKKEAIIETLKEKSETTDSIQQKIEEEIKEHYWEQQTITKFEIVMGFVELLLIGGPTFRLGKKIYFEKYTHPITKEKIYVYDDYSRKYGLLFMILGMVVFVGLSLYAYLIFFNV